MRAIGSGRVRYNQRDAANPEDQLARDRTGEGETPT